MAIPIAVLGVIIAAPFIYRSMQFRGIPPIDAIVDPEIDGRVVLLASENAFTFFQHAAAMLPAVSGSANYPAAVATIDRGEHWSAVPTDIRDHLKKCQLALEEWKIGTELDDGNYLDVAALDYSALLPAIQDLRRFSRLAVIQMLRCNDEGKTDQAWTWLRATLRSSRHAGKHGVAIERLAGSSIHSGAAKAIVHWASQDEVLSEQLRKALEDVREINRLTPAMSATMKPEAILAMNSLRDSQQCSELLPSSRRVHSQLMPAYLFVKGDPELSRELVAHAFSNYLSQCDLRPSDRTPTIARFGLYRPTGKEVPSLMEPSRLSDAVMNSLLARRLVRVQNHVISRP